MQLSLVIPAYNEEKNVKDVVESYSKAFESIKYLEFEIIVVNDNSTDSTSEIVSRMQNVKLISNDTNSGYGFSLKKGISESLFDIIMITDADGSYTDYDAVNLIKKYDDEDMLIGSRNGSNVNIQLYRRPAKFILNRYASFLSYSKVPDVNSGLRIFKKSKYEMYKKFLPDAFSFTTTITLSMINSREKVKFVPIDYLKRGGISKINPVKDFLTFMSLITKLSLYFNPLKIFSSISISLVLFAISLFSYCKYYDILIPDVLLITTLFTAVLVFCLGLLADLINMRVK